MPAWRPSDTELLTTYGNAFVSHRREQITTVCDLLDGMPGHAIFTATRP
ncbi:hypothetical protein [Amycolatopsis thermoflava]